MQTSLWLGHICQGIPQQIKTIRHTQRQCDKRWAAGR